MGKAGHDDDYDDDDDDDKDDDGDYDYNGEKNHLNHLEDIGC